MTGVGGVFQMTQNEAKIIQIVTIFVFNESNVVL